MHEAGIKMWKILRAVALPFAAHLVCLAQTLPAAIPPDIAVFNSQYAEATRRMDNVAIIALWAEDGVSLLPSTKPIVGKAAIAQFLADVTSSLKGATMESFQMECFDAVVANDLASEWCTEHQLVRLGGGKAPFDGHGKMLLVLRRGSDRLWRIEREMWNQAI
jgi:ketosteroid isomerase-like protein